MKKLGFQIFATLSALFLQSCNLFQDDNQLDPKLRSNIIGCWTSIRANGVGCIEWCFDPSSQFYGIDQEKKGSDNPIEHFGSFTVDSNLATKLKFDYFCESGKCKLKSNDTLTINWAFANDTIFNLDLNSVPFSRSSATTNCKDHWKGISKPENWTLE